MYPIVFLFQNADASDIKKGFRRLSLVLHPDKSDAPDAEIKFRQVIMISSVMRDWSVTFCLEEEIL